MADVEITFRLSAELAAKARERGWLTDETYAEWLQHKLEQDDEDDEEYEDTPDEVILEDLRVGLIEALQGRNLRPADEVLAELRARREREKNVEEADKG